MIHIYCDESCHLPNDNFDVMVLGGTACDTENITRIKSSIRLIKRKYGLTQNDEIKWTNVSNNLLPLYKELIDFFFFEDALSFRGLVALEKKKLNHTKYNSGSFDEWYYKMYFYLIDGFIYPQEEYRIFIDVKDTNGGPRVQKLHTVLCNNHYDFKANVIKNINQVTSDRNDLLQLTDLLIGSLSYYYRGLIVRDNAKADLVNYIIEKSNNKFHGTNKNESKFNIFKWKPRGE